MWLLLRTTYFQTISSVVEERVNICKKVAFFPLEKGGRAEKVVRKGGAVAAAAAAAAASEWVLLRRLDWEWVAGGRQGGREGDEMDRSLSLLHPFVDSFGEVVPRLLLRCTYYTWGRREEQARHLLLLGVVGIAHLLHFNKVFLFPVYVGYEMENVPPLVPQNCAT